MSRFSFLCGVGIAAMSGALAAVPASASDDGSGVVIAQDGSAGTPQSPGARIGRNVAAQFDQLIEQRRNREGVEANSSGTASDGISSNVASALTIRAIASPNTIDSFASLRSSNFSVADFGPITFDAITLGGGLIANITDADPRIIARDDLGIDGIVDTENQWPSVVQMFQQDNATGGVFLNCTGTVINPRTILTAAHCLYNSSTRSSEAYGLPGQGGRSILIASGVNSADRLFTYLGDGSSYSEGGVATSTDVIIHPSANVDTDGNLPFPWADVALIAVDEPITDVPALPVLLSPLGELTHVIALGYGTNGTGLQGAVNTGSPFLRRVGENMLGLIGTQADFIDQVFPAFAPSFNSIGQNTQTLYWFDFDNPDRTDAEKENCIFTGTNISCADLNAVRAIDYFDGDALDREVATAPGDSGSPLIVDELYDFPVVSAVLSGGYDFFGTNNTYGDVSFYNPLFPFFEFITENTSYKYVSALEGDGVWSDPTRWTQELDPGFFVDDGNGNLVNGIPAGEELGVYTTGPKIGTVLGVDISEGPTDTSPSLPAFGTPGFGPFLPESSELLGPGSTGFVPQNTDGIVGTAFENPAQYFEVLLTRAGTTTVDLDVTIDRLVIDSADAGFVLPDEWAFESLINVEQLSGFAQIDGTLTTPIYTLGSGELAGEGTIDTNGFFNVAGLLSAGGDGAYGSLIIDGDYVQTAAGGLLSEFTVVRRNTILADSYEITGTAVLDGLLLVATNDRRPRFGTKYTVLTANAIDGDFSDLAFFTRSATLDAVHRIEGNEVIVEITARSVAGLVGPGNSLESLGDTLDAIRASNFAEFADMFALIDSAGIDTLGATLASLTPSSAFTQSFTANAFAQRFTGQIAQRTLALRGGSRAVGAFSGAGNASFALAGGVPEDAGRLGLFGSVSGVYRDRGQLSVTLGVSTLGFDAPGANAMTNVVIGANALEQAALTEAGELTLGADLRVSDALSFGVAISDIRNSQATTGILQPQDNRSQSVAVYATYSEGAAFADAYAGTSRQEFGLDRNSQGNLATGFANAIGNADGRQVFGGMRLGYGFDLAEGFEVGPVASLDYVRSDIGGYNEQGAGRFGLSVADRTFTSLGAKAGAMASLDIKAGDNNVIRAFGSVAYAHELADSADVVTAYFAGAADTPFSIANALDPQWVSVNAGAEMALGANLQAIVSFTSDMGRGPLSNDQGRVSLNWQF